MTDNETFVAVVFIVAAAIVLYRLVEGLFDG